MAKPDRLWFTEDDEANKLLASDPFALLVGFALDQQITVQQAFQGPLRIKQRLGTLDPKTLAKTDLEPAFREKPAVHRFPGAMAARVQDLAAYVADEYGGDASRLWREATGGDDLKRRVAELPGFGDMKVRSMTAVLAKRFGVGVAKDVAPKHPTLGDVDSAQSLVDYQAAKRAYKAKLRSTSAR
ncbi:MAG TPA: HhH-GPD-type base excision DNA repair protein [Gaiellaceae bacterium]|nr:HhH-GPD-type base excision DNA repair protein [Gaiellaceae bacterium]